ncbi:MAG: hypothetical protein Ct9H90mP25_0340 [Gammaproteobacteria bacterium]|nr:MAG: hypothetical protein Ct9H90mP25_0340 [Gammaproteobacteria bacterium]
MEPSRKSANEPLRSCDRGEDWPLGEPDLVLTGPEMTDRRCTGLVGDIGIVPTG